MQKTCKKSEKSGKQSIKTIIMNCRQMFQTDIHKKCSENNLTSPNKIHPYKISTKTLSE